MSGKINNMISLFTNSAYRVEFCVRHGLYNKMQDEKFLKKVFKSRMGYELDLENPKTYNEKMQWLKLYNRKAEYTMMVDKFKVRDYIEKKIGKEYLIPLLGVWDNPDDIDFETLPNQFVLKCNHNSGLGMCICKDKKKLDIAKVKEELKKGLRQNYYLIGREWPYKNVTRKVICEKFMKEEGIDDLRDFKFYCFDGKVKMLGIYSDRNSQCHTKADFFDRDFNWLNLKWGYLNAENPPKKPFKFEEMIKIAEKLSEDIPVVRVDLYLCGERIYFGELTFFDGSGFDKIEPAEWDLKMGDWIPKP